MNEFEQENKELYQLMLDNECEFVCHDGKAHFISADGKYEPYPVGYITGPTKDEDRENWYCSVQGPNGWHQKTLGHRAEVVAWAKAKAAAVKAAAKVEETI